MESEIKMNVTASHASLDSRCNCICYGYFN